MPGVELDELVTGMLTGALVGAGAAMLLWAPANLVEDRLRAGPRRILEGARGRVEDALAEGREAAARTRASLEHLRT
jgi:gas vesicle protein